MEKMNNRSSLKTYPKKNYKGDSKGEPKKFTKALPLKFSKTLLEEFPNKLQKNPKKLRRKFLKHFGRDDPQIFEQLNQIINVVYYINLYEYSIN